MSLTDLYPGHRLNLDAREPCQFCFKFHDGGPQDLCGSKFHIQAIRSNLDPGFKHQSWSKLLKNVVSLLVTIVFKAFLQCRFKNVDPYMSPCHVTQPHIMSEPPSCLAAGEMAAEDHPCPVALDAVRVPKFDLGFVREHDAFPVIHSPVSVGSPVIMCLPVLLAEEGLLGFLRALNPI
jgi:hypothetical protein